MSLAPPLRSALAFVASTIVGATLIPQLAESLDAFATTPDRGTRDETDDIHLRHANPAP